MPQITDLLFSQNLLISLALASFFINSFHTFFAPNPISTSLVGSRFSSLERLFSKSVAVLDFTMMEGFTISESNDFITDLNKWYHWAVTLKYFQIRFDKSTDKTEKR